MSESMEGVTPSKPDTRFDVDGRRGAPVVFSFAHGYAKPDEEIKVWPPAPIVLHDEKSGRVAVDFNRWSDCDDAPPLEYNSGLVLPFPWAAAAEDLQTDEVRHKINNALCEKALLPVPIYTPTGFLMLSGARHGGRLIAANYQAPVMNSFAIIEAYLQATFMLERAEDQPHARQVAENVRKNYFTHCENLLVAFAKKMDTDDELLAYADELRDTFNSGGHEAIAAAGTEHTADLLRMAAYMVTFQKSYMELCEGRLFALISPQLKSIPRSYYTQAPLPGAAESQPLHWFAKGLAQETREYEFSYLRLKAKQLSLDFLEPAQLSTEHMEHGMSLHFLRLMLLLLTQQPKAFTVWQQKQKPPPAAK